jgi:5,10-methylenetetrahydromethanopterin reductase
MDWRWTDSPGVALMGHGLPAGATDWARAAEGEGFGSIWVPEDHFHPGAYALAAAAATATRRVTIGLGVVNVYTRHPALVAMETSALAGLAPDRVVLGLGTSNRRWIEEQMAIPFPTPLSGLREGTEIVRRLLAGERITRAGRCSSVRGVELEAVPPARVPILLGVKGTPGAGPGRRDRRRRALLGARLPGPCAPRARRHRGGATAGRPLPRDRLRAHGRQCRR